MIVRFRCRHCNRVMGRKKTLCERCLRDPEAREKHLKPDPEPTAEEVERLVANGLAELRGNR